MPEHMDQNNSEYGHFSRSELFDKFQNEPQQFCIKS